MIKVQNFSFMKMHLNMPSAKWRPFCPGENELRVDYWPRTFKFIAAINPHILLLISDDVLGRCGAVAWTMYRSMASTGYFAATITKAKVTNCSYIKPHWCHNFTSTIHNCICAGINQWSGIRYIFSLCFLSRSTYVGYIFLGLLQVTYIHSKNYHAKGLAVLSAHIMWIPCNAKWAISFWNI